MSNEYGYGREEIAYVVAESAFGTLAAPSATDAVKVLKTAFTPSQERVDRNEKGATRSLLSRISRRKSVEWSLEKYLLPSGAKGTKPDGSDLWKALFGIETVNASTSVVYTLAAEPSTSLSLFRNYGPHREAVAGAVPSKLSLSFGGGDEPKVTFSGAAKSHMLCGSDTLASAASATSTITVTDARQFDVGMVIKVGDDDNTGSGFTITAIDYDTDQLTLSASVTDEALGAAVVPLPLTATTTGTVIPIIVGTLTIGGTTVYVTEAGFEIDQKIAMRNDEFGTDSARGYRHPERRSATMNLSLYFERGAAKWLNDAKRFTSQDIQVVLGETDGSTVQIDANQVEFDIPAVEVPDSGECTLGLSGVCLGSAGEDEISVTFR